jgi:DNA-binding MarR family transcriptional regulator
MQIRQARADEIDCVRKQWKREQPDLDTSTMETIGRTLRIQFLFSARMRRVLSRYDIDPGGFDMLATLRRSGPPYRMTPTRLYKELVLTSGAVTHRMDALEKATLLERRTDPEDRRSMLACLTAKGRQLVDAAMRDHMAAEAAVANCLTQQEHKTLAQLLKKILLELEEEK